MDYILIGRIVNTHGLKGEVKIQSYSDFDEERYQKGNIVYLFKENQYLSLRVATFRKHKGMSLVSFVAHQDINLVECFKNCNVYVSQADRKPLKEGKYYRDQLKGLCVQDEENHVIGKSIAIEETQGAQNNLRVKKEDGSEFLIPFIDEFIRNVDLENNTIMIHLEEGLL